MRSRVLDDPIISNDVLLGTGSLVTPGKHLESGYLYLGNLARRIHPLTLEEIGSQQLRHLKRWLPKEIN